MLQFTQKFDSLENRYVGHKICHVENVRYIGCDNQCGGGCVCFFTRGIDDVLWDGMKDQH